MFLYRICLQYLLLYGAKVKNIFVIPTNDDKILKYLDRIQIKKTLVEWRYYCYNCLFYNKKDDGNVIVVDMKKAFIYNIINCIVSE